MFNKSKKYKIFTFLLIILCCNFVALSSNSAVRSVGSDTGSVVITEEKSCWQKGFRLTFCPTGSCTTCIDISNNIKYFKAPLCDTKGYINSCPAGTGQTLDSSTQLGCDKSYSKSCVCDSSYKYGEGREECSNVKGGGSCTIDKKTYYKTCECSDEYKFICNPEMGQEPANPNDSCDKRYKQCKCTKSSVGENESCTKKVSNDLTCYVDCKSTPKTCKSQGLIDVENYWCNGALKFWVR